MNLLRYIAAFSLAFSRSEGWYSISDNDLALSYGIHMLRKRTRGVDTTTISSRGIRAGSVI